MACLIVEFLKVYLVASRRITVTDVVTTIIAKDYQYKYSKLVSFHFSN